jgi:hypothetical protein
MNIRLAIKKYACVVVALAMAATLLTGTFDACASSGQADEEIIIVARNYIFIDDISGNGVVIGSKKGHFKPTEFKGTAGTAVLMFMYNRISRDKCVQLISKLYEIERDAVAPKVDSVLAFLEENELLLTSKYPNPSRNYGMNKFRPEE